MFVLVLQHKKKVPSMFPACREEMMVLQHPAIIQWGLHPSPCRDCPAFTTDGSENQITSGYDTRVVHNLFVKWSGTKTHVARKGLSETWTGLCCHKSKQFFMAEFLMSIATLSASEEKLVRVLCVCVCVNVSESLGPGSAFARKNEVLLGWP